MEGMSAAIERLGLTFEIFHCPVHGEVRALRLPGSKGCAECVMDANKDAVQKKWVAERQDQLLRISAIPHRFKSAGLRDFREINECAASVKRAISGYLQQLKLNPHQWCPLILSGLPGTGKTHLLCALANNLIHASVGCHYTTMQTMLAEIKKSYSSDLLTEAGQIFKYVINSSLLIIDEVDVMRASDNDIGLLFAVINGRYNELRPVAIATNQAIEKLPELLSERIVDRLRENALTLRCDWPSQRST